jgi:hypothetical protein
MQASFRRFVRFAVFGAALFFAIDGRAGEIAKQWRGVTRFRGALSVEFHEWIHERTTTSDKREEAQVHFVMEVDSSPGLTGMTWRATEAAITGSIHGEADVIPYGRSTTEASFSGAPVSLGDFTLTLDPTTGVWQLVSPGILAGKYPVVSRFYGDDPNVVTEKSDAVQSVVFNGKVAVTPGLINGSYTYEGLIDRQPTRGFSKIGSLQLWPEYDDLEVEVTIDGYDDWRPLGSIDRPAEPGNHLIARATLVPKAGRTSPTPEVKSFRFELLDTSSEPGVCLNWPRGAKVASAPKDQGKTKAKDLDLRLAFAPPFLGVLSDEEQTNEVTLTLNDDQGHRYAEAQVNSYDFGGRATLRVTCTLADGRELLGLMKREGGGYGVVLIPKRFSGDWIAQRWREDQRVVELSDRDDSEDSPIGDGTKGDGFTLYEEYRGWVENGIHISGDPKTKDLFVRLKGAGIALPGVEKFQQLTGLNVHSSLTAAEFPASRIMNANRDRGPNVTDQHGVLVRIKKKPTDPAQLKQWNPNVSIAVGGPGNPKTISSVDLMTDVASFSANYAAITVAHELGHCVNLWHHGDVDWRVVWAVVDGKLYEARPDKTASEISVINEEGDDLTPMVMNDALEIQAKKPAGQHLLVQMGRDQGQHSGFEDCIMRYDDAQTFVDRSRTDVRFYDFNEPLGYGLCTTGEGSGVNDKDRKDEHKQPRYGPALKGRGDCLHQIHVTDADTSLWRSPIPRPP